MIFTNFIAHGLLQLPWWGYLLFILITTHITILAVTIFLHRHQAHRALDLHPLVSHFFRFWLWFTTGMVTKEWAAIHRKHHAFSDKEGDPHSPNLVGLTTVLSMGVELYQQEAKNPGTLQKYGSHTPSDWLERNVYAKHSKVGIGILLTLNIILFGPIGLSIWAVQMLWIPIFAAGIVNGVGHYWGYRNFPCIDKARNIIPLGIFIGGEELHNNHHTFATSAKLSYKWYEFDLGWMWIRILAACNLATVKKVSPILHKAKVPKLLPDAENLAAVLANRYSLTMYFYKTLKNECKIEVSRLQTHLHISWAKFKNILIKDADMLTKEEQSLLPKVIERSLLLQKIIDMRFELANLWQRSNLNSDELVQKLQNWCHKAEHSGIKNLQIFSLRLRACY